MVFVIASGSGEIMQYRYTAWNVSAARSAAADTAWKASESIAAADSLTDDDPDRNFAANLITFSDAIFKDSARVRL